jgi:hypothetical protein
VSASDDFDAERRIVELERAAVRLQRQLAAAKAKTEDLVQAVRDAAHDAMLVTGRPKPVPRPKLGKGKGDPEHALVHLTDWQLGKETADYNTDICVARVRHVVERVRRITAIQRKDHPVPEVTVMLGGDHIEGVGIFPGQAYEVDSTGYSQLMVASNLMVEVVLTLLQDFDRVHVRSVHGNHGRIGRKGDMPRVDNMDLIAFHIARSMLSDQPRVDWPENLHWYDEVRVGNYRALLVHGDQIKGFSGTPAFAIARKMTAWSSGAIPFQFSDAFLGHYHQNLVLTLPNGGQVRMTPSTESGSQYASEFMAAQGRPGQRLLMVHPEHGSVTGEWMLWLG